MTMLHFNAFLAYPVEPTACSAAHLKILREKRSINVEMMLFTSKLNAYLSHFLLLNYIYFFKHYALFSKIVVLFYCFEETCIGNILLDAPSCGLVREAKVFFF